MNVVHCLGFQLALGIAPPAMRHSCKVEERHGCEIRFELGQVRHALHCQP